MTDFDRTRLQGLATDEELKAISNHTNQYGWLRRDGVSLERLWRDPQGVLCIRWSDQRGRTEWYHYSAGCWY